MNPYRTNPYGGSSESSGAEEDAPRKAGRPRKERPAEGAPRRKRGRPAKEGPRMTEYRRKKLARERRAREAAAAELARIEAAKREDAKKRAIAFAEDIARGARHSDALPRHGFADWPEFKAAMEAEIEAKVAYEKALLVRNEFRRIQREDHMHGRAMGEIADEQLTPKGTVVAVRATDTRVLIRLYDQDHPVPKSDPAGADAADYVALLKRVAEAGSGNGA